jgi:SHS2 domain-containing protein
LVIGARHQVETHGGEIRLHVDADSLTELFAEAARGLARLQLEAPEDVPQEELPVEEVHLEAADLPTLLVDWLNELILRSETRHKVFTDVYVESASDRHIDAIVRGVPPGELRSEVKGASLYHIEVGSSDGGLCARISLEV